MDLRTATRRIYQELQLAAPAEVMQCPTRDPATGHWYASQNPVGSSDLVMSHCDASGKLIDSATYKGAGHGSTIGYIPGRGLVFNWQASSKVYVVAYKPGTFTESSAKGTELAFHTGNAVVSVDQINGFLCYRLKSPSGKSESYTLRRTADVFAKVDNPVGKAGTFPTDPPIFQGHCSNADLLFMPKGLGHTDESQQVKVASLSTGKMLYSIDIRPLPTEFIVQEPEGFTIFADKAGNTVYGLGMTARTTNKIRRHFIIQFVPEETSMATKPTPPKYDPAKQNPWTWDGIPAPDPAAANAFWQPKSYLTDIQKRLVSIEAKLDQLLKK